jgi:stage IV sporulation protein FB
MEDFIEYQRFPSFEDASELIDILEKNNIPYEVDESALHYGMVSFGSPLDNQLIVKIREVDFEKANLLTNSPEVNQYQFGEVHYMYAYSDKEILDVITNPSEWHNTDVEVALKIAKERNLNLPTESKQETDAISEHDSYPPKPTVDEQKNSITKSFTSLLLFVVAFYLIFHWDLKYIFILIGVLLLHEFGHYIAMRIFKYNELNIFFIPLIGAFASGTKNTISQKQEAIILLSGPLPGVILGTILYSYGLQINSNDLIRIADILVVINLFNLLPVMPLDGGRLVKNLFFESNNVINTIFLSISIVALSYFAIYTQSYFLLIIPFLLLGQLANQGKIKKIRNNLTGQGIELDKSYDELTNQEYWLIRDEIGTNINLYKKDIEPKKYVISNKENRIINQVKAIIHKQPIKDIQIGGKIFIVLIWICIFYIPLALIFGQVKDKTKAKEKEDQVEINKIAKDMQSAQFVSKDSVFTFFDLTIPLLSASHYFTSQIKDESLITNFKDFNEDRFVAACDMITLPENTKFDINLLGKKYTSLTERECPNKKFESSFCVDYTKKVNDTITKKGTIFMIKDGRIIYEYFTVYRRMDKARADSIFDYLIKKVGYQNEMGREKH